MELIWFKWAHLSLGQLAWEKEYPFTIVLLHLKRTSLYFCKVLRLLVGSSLLSYPFSQIVTVNDLQIPHQCCCFCSCPSCADIISCRGSSYLHGSYSQPPCYSWNLLTSQSVLVNAFVDRWPWVLLLHHWNFCRSCSFLAHMWHLLFWKGGHLDGLEGIDELLKGCDHFIKPHFLQDIFLPICY